VLVGTLLSFTFSREQLNTNEGAMHLSENCDVGKTFIRQNRYQEFLLYGGQLDRFLESKEQTVCSPDIVNMDDFKCQHSFPRTPILP
jgi:hypothetical protein